MAKDYARERKRSFYAKTKVSAFANFEVDRLIKKKKKMKNQHFGHSLYVIIAVNFTCFESFIVFKNTRRPCFVSAKAYSCPVREI